MSLKQFEIIEMIAKGGMAEVYKAKTTGFQGFEKEVCVKKILPELTSDPSFVRMFINEAKLAATLNYNNIVAVQDLCVSGEGEYFIVMEYVSGKDLSDVIRASKTVRCEVPVNIAVYVCREVCRGLQYAHTKTNSDGEPLNIIHRDISPHNILVSLMGEVKITDFGIAKASLDTEKTAVGILKGKYGYMSPEQSLGLPLDGRSDIFNAGIILYELLVGERCFAGATDLSTLALMRSAEVTPPRKIKRDIPEQLEKICLKALARKPEKRFQTAHEFEQALESFSHEARSSTHASDVSEYMNTLFGGGRESGATPMTSILSLSSVKSPPEPDDEVKAKPEPKAAPKASAKPESKPPPAAEPEEEPAKKAPPKPQKEKSAKKKAPPAQVEESAAKVAEDKTEEPPAKRPVQSAKKDRQPARLKQDKSSKARASAADKKPVGRRILRPGLTRIQAMEGHTSKKRTLKTAVIVATASAALGFLVGFVQGQQMLHQDTFRQVETTGGSLLADSVVVVVRSQPSGARVEFDGEKIPGRTPLAFKRKRDAKEHKLSILLSGHKTSKTVEKYSKDPSIIVSATLKTRTSGTKSPNDLTFPWTGKDAAIIEILSTPTAKITINGVRTNEWTNGKQLHLKPGVEHRLTFQAWGSKKRTTIRLTLGKGQKKQIHLDLS